MDFKIVPVMGSRYWVGITVASICGANIGDVPADEFGLSNAAGIAALAAAFAAIVSVNQRSRNGHESLFWIAIIIVRAAATNIADLAIGRSHTGYWITAAALAALLTVTLAVGSAMSAGAESRALRAGPGYWATMLIAGTLGTVLGDGMGHAIAPITIGVPVSACIAAMTVAAIFVYRAKHGISSAGTASYWVAIPAIRALGTNLADIAAYLLSLPVSIALSSLLLAGVLTAWRDPRPEMIEQPRRGGWSDRRRLNRISPQSGR